MVVNLRKLYGELSKYGIDSNTVKGMPEEEPYVFVKGSMTEGKKSRIKFISGYLSDKERINVSNPGRLVEIAEKLGLAPFKIRENCNGLEFSYGI